MATQQDPKSDAKTGPSAGGKETYRYGASSFRIKTNEEELFELVQLSEVPVDKELFKVILELLKLNVAPVAILQVLKSLKAQSTQDQTPPASKESSRSRHKPVPVATRPTGPSSTKRTTPKPGASTKTQPAKGSSVVKEHSSTSQKGSEAQRRPSSKLSSRSLRTRTGSGSGDSRKDTSKTT